MLECQFRKKLNIKRLEFQLILQMIAIEINSTITMTNQELETRIMHYRNLSKQILHHSVCKISYDTRAKNFLFTSVITSRAFGSCCKLTLARKSFIALVS